MRTMKQLYIPYDRKDIFTYLEMPRVSLRKHVDTYRDKKNCIIILKQKNHALSLPPPPSLSLSFSGTIFMISLVISLLSER